MATQDNSPGLLSKVARFVRNPTTDWADLDKVDLPPGEVSSKDALKKMIERKRFDDAQRKREFDQLRKLRRASPATAPVPSGLSSLSPDSSETAERATTLKKIDEIEAQMSKQWWKGHPGAAPSKLAEVQKDPATLKPATGPEAGDSQDTFASTISFNLHAEADNVATQIGAVQASDLRFDPSYGRSAMPNNDLSAPGAPALDEAQDPPDPTLEEAAIRFANGDDAGADAVLQAALLDQAASPALVEAWAGALFDLYRSTGQPSNFESFAIDYTRRFGRTAPAWFSVPERLAGHLASKGLSNQLQGISPAPLVWTCPAELTVQALAQLAAFVSPDQALNRLNWHALQSINPQAGLGLAELFARWCSQPLTLYFEGVEALELCLRAASPTGQRQVPTYGWQLRLELCRMMRWQDEFDMAALDFCILFEVSPPPWQEPLCRLLAEPDANLPTSLVTSAQAELAGEVLGDAEVALLPLKDACQAGELLVVSCSDLIRVDFSAAGSILNWAAKVQSSGGQIEMHDVSRLVAAFFNLVGINEHVRVIARTN